MENKIKKFEIRVCGDQSCHNVQIELLCNPITYKSGHWKNKNKKKFEAIFNSKKKNESLGLFISPQTSTQKKKILKLGKKL